MRLLRPSATALLLAGLLLAQTNASAQLASKGCPSFPSFPRPWEIVTDDWSSSGPLQVLSDTMGVDFNPYLTHLLREVKEHWYQLIPESARWKRGKVVLEFQVLKDGRVNCLNVVESSGDAMLDRPAYGSIAGSNPFLPLPKEFSGPYLGLRFRYFYNMDDKKRGLSIRPAGSTVAAGSTVQLWAFEYDRNAAVTWRLVACDDACGTISSTGLYLAPPKIPNPSKVRIRATVVLIPDDTAEATVTVVEPKH